MDHYSNYNNLNFEENINNDRVSMKFDNNNIINDEEFHINLNNPEMNYETASDIEDPKYIPAGNIIQNQENFENHQNPENLDNFGVPSENQMFLQTQIMNLENDTMMVNKTLQQLENENDQLKEQLIKNQKKVETKESMNNEYKQILVAFKQRFEQYEKRNNSLQQYINQLEERLKKLYL